MGPDSKTEKEMKKVIEAAHDYIKPPEEIIWSPKYSSTCPAKAVAVLGFKTPTEIPCGLLDGHLGPHHYEITWSNDGQD